MIKNRKQRRAALGAMKSYVQALRLNASFMSLRELQRRDPESAECFAEMISERGYQPGEVLLYDHSEGTSVMFPPEFFPK